MPCRVHKIEAQPNIALLNFPVQTRVRAFGFCPITQTPSLVVYCHTPLTTRPFPASQKIEKELDSAKQQFAEFERKDVKMREDLKHLKEKLKKLDQKAKKVSSLLAVFAGPGFGF
jgi:septal ring factor EnvC (AmiA/AmiB activator)